MGRHPPCEGVVESPLAKPPLALSAAVGAAPQTPSTCRGVGGWNLELRMYVVVLAPLAHTEFHPRINRPSRLGEGGSAPSKPPRQRGFAPLLKPAIRLPSSVTYIFGRSSQRCLIRIRSRNPLEDLSKERVDGAVRPIDPSPSLLAWPTAASIPLSVNEGFGSSPLRSDEPRPRSHR